VDFSILAVVAVCLGTVTFSSRLASASTLGTDRARANQLSSRSIGSARTSTTSGKSTTWPRSSWTGSPARSRTPGRRRGDQTNVARATPIARRGHLRLRDQRAAASNNPLFSNSASKIARPTCTTSWPRQRRRDLSNLKNYKIELTQERNILASEVGRAASLTRAAAKSFHSADVFQASLNTHWLR